VVGERPTPEPSAGDRTRTRSGSGPVRDVDAGVLGRLGGHQLVQQLACGAGRRGQASAASPGDWVRVHVPELRHREVGLARRRSGRLAAPARVTREVLHELVAAEAPRHPGVDVPDRNA
jgi:hypothetical protein